MKYKVETAIVLIAVGIAIWIWADHFEECEQVFSWHYCVFEALR